MNRTKTQAEASHAAGPGEDAGLGKVLYPHAPLGTEVRAAAGYYLLEEEKRISFHGREVLYARGYVAVESSCCGTGGCAFVVVPGYVLGWRTGRNDKGEPVSQVQPIRDQAAREEIRRLLLETERVQQVNFW